MAVSRRAFDSIESAHDYLGLLVSTVEKEAASAHAAAEAASTRVTDRHRDAMRLVDYKLRCLSSHLVISRRLLSDLKKLRRYLLEERKTLTRNEHEQLAEVAAHNCKSFISSRSDSTREDGDACTGLHTSSRTSL